MKTKIMKTMPLIAHLPLKRKSLLLSLTIPNQRLSFKMLLDKEIHLSMLATQIRNKNRVILPLHSKLSKEEDVLQQSQNSRT